MQCSVDIFLASTFHIISTEVTSFVIIRLVMYRKTVVIAFKYKKARIPIVCHIFKLTLKAIIP